MNRPIRNVAIACMLLFLALMINATYLQYWQASDLTSLAKHPDNQRVRIANYSELRGAITVAGKPIAESRESKDQYKYLRTYPLAREYAALTGFFGYEFGPMGIEASQNSILAGQDPRLFVNRLVELLRNQSTQGGTVELTINPAAQKAAYDGLRALGTNVQGAVVAIEPSTGKILAMVSSPSYDPNKLASHDFTAVANTWQNLVANPLSPLNNNAIEQRLPPGSTFKLITAAAALESGRFHEDSKVKGGPSLTLPLTTKRLVNENGETCGGDPITLKQALEVSCNVSFGWLGLQLGADALRAQADKFGFGTTPFHDLDDSLTSQVPSVFPSNPDAPETAFSAIGQFDVAATPLQMAMVAAGIANDGEVMAPYLVDQVKSADLEVLDSTAPKVLNAHAISAATARELTDMMVGVVDNGTGTNAQIPGISVAGKTGTAQSLANRPPYAWFVSFAPANSAPKVAVAVLVQNAGVDRGDISGNGLAAPIARRVMQAVLGQ
jgi:peptidoglycan glycosyltransferase